LRLSSAELQVERKRVTCALKQRDAWRKKADQQTKLRCYNADSLQAV
jgi:hypothetical protein